MNQAVLLLAQTLQSLPIEALEWQENCLLLITQVLKGRPICRVRDGVPLDGICLEILDAVHHQLRSRIEHDHAAQRLCYPSPSIWSREHLHLAFKQVLTEERLQRLALRVQAHQPKTVAWNHTLNELLYALDLSGCLTTRSGLNRQLSVPLTEDAYQDVRNKTMQWIAERLQDYASEKYLFMAWVNGRMRWTAIEAAAADKDPLVKKSYHKVRKLKAALKATLERVTQDSVLNWLALMLRKLVPVDAIAHHILLLLSAMYSLWHDLCHRYTESERHDFLYAIAKQIVNAPTAIVNFGDQTATEGETVADANWQLNQITYEPQPPEGLLLRECLLNAPSVPFDEHIRNHPEATFRAIALAYLDDQKWQDIADSFDIANLSTVRNFYIRKSEKFGPQLRELFEIELARWKHKNP